MAFEVPAATGLALGSLVVVRPEPSVEGSDDLLRAGNVRGTPRLGEPFASAEGDTVGAFVSLHPGESSEPPELTLEVSRNGDVVSRAVADLPGPDTSGRVTHLVQLPAEAFAPGRYVLRARARQGTEEATAATSFRVVAPEASMAPAGDKERMAVPVNVPADATPILEAAARYLVEFQEKFQDLVAEESYRQWAGSEIRTLRSDVVFVTLDRSVPWVTLRDVFEVDGQEVRDREERLQELFLERDASTLERADAILRESARFNLGPAYRTINAPTFSLVMLLPEHRGRFTWERKGSREFHGRTGVELRAVESRRPTLVRDTTGADVPAEVQFWIEPGTGRVLSASVHYLFPVESNRQRGAASEQPSAWVDTHYRPEPSLALWVPDSMYERYENVTGQSLWSGKSFEIIEARARYSEYRRFEVETSEGDARVGESEATRSSERRSRQTPP